MRFAFVVLVALAASSVARGADWGSLAPPSPSLGERARLTLESAPADSTEQPVGVGVVLQDTELPTEFVVVPVRVGEVGIALAGDTLSWNVERRIEEAAQERLRPVKSVGAIEPNWWPTILVALAIVAPLAWLLWRLLRGRRRVETAFPIPEEPAHLVALRRLEEIEREAWLRDGKVEHYYVEASLALRRYVAGRFRVPALDWTSAELVAKLRAAGYTDEIIRPVSPLLAAADDVKFAGGVPAEHRSQEWLVAIRDYVTDTKVEIVYSTPEALAAARELA